MTSLTKAQEYFKLEMYADALREYELYSKNSQLPKVDVSLNIYLCQQRLKYTSEAKKSFIESDVEHGSMFELKLEHCISKNKNDKLLINFFEKIKTNQLEKIEVWEILDVLKYSPFQISLLLLAACVCIKNGGQSELFRVSSESLNLATLIRSVIDYKFWLDNKVVILSKMEELGLTTGGRFFGDKFRSFTIDAVSSYQAVSQAIQNIENFNSYNQQKKADICLSIGSILLNESKFIGLNLVNHYDLCDEWILVEGACQGYPTRKVTEKGLSLDNSALQILLFPDIKNKIRFIQYGWTTQTGEDAKSELRNVYLKYVTGEILLVLDIDEFYSANDVDFVIKKFQKNKELTAFTLPQVHFWKGTEQFITGGYYDISHTRFFRNIFGMKYVSNHNFPEINGVMLNKMKHEKEKRVIKELKNNLFKYEGPRCYHMGFSKDEDDMRDKTDYYVNRGEDITRKNTTDSRAGWFNDILPEECKVRKWGGGLPNVLKKKS